MGTITQLQIINCCGIYAGNYDKCQGKRLNAEKYLKMLLKNVDENCRLKKKPFYH